MTDTLINNVELVGHALVEENGEKRRKRALVPGCGRGVDVLLLESFGYDVVGLEYAEGAFKACLEYAAEHAKDYPVQDERVGKGSRKYVRGDFYADDWLVEAGLDKNTKFDLIYDYTVSTVLSILCPFKTLLVHLPDTIYTVLLCDADFHAASLVKENDRAPSPFSSSQPDLSRVPDTETRDFGRSSMAFSTKCLCKSTTFPNI